MNSCPDIRFDEKYIAGVTLIGQGGKENILQRCFLDRQVKRVNHRLYDFEMNGEKIEVKRQQASNWFDYGKFHNLSEEEKNITMLFFMHKNQIIQAIFGIRLSNLIELCCNDPLCRSQGWTKEAINDAYKIKNRYPAVEHKAPLNVKKLYERYPEAFRLYFHQ